MKTSISGARCCCNTASKNTNLTFRKSPKGRWLVLSISTVTRTDAISNFYCWIQRQLFPLSHTLLQSVSFHFPSQACYAVLFSSCKHKSATVLWVQVLNGKLGNTGNLRGISEVLLLLTYNEGRLILFFLPPPSGAANLHLRPRRMRGEEGRRGGNTLPTHQRDCPQSYHHIAFCRNNQARKRG